MSVRALVAGIERAGVERERFYSQVGLSETQLDDGLARMPKREYRQLVRAALASSGDPALGLHMGEDANSSWFDVLGHLAQHSLSLREALRVCSRYARIAKDGPSLALHEDGDSATIQLNNIDGDPCEIRFTSEFAMSALLRQLVSRFVGDALPPRRAYFCYPAPEHRDEYARIFSGRAQFAHAFTGLELDRVWLDRKQLHHSAELCAWLQARADLLLARLDRGTPTSARVEHWLASHSLSGRPTMSAIARDLGMSARSLRRRLAEENMDFTVLLDDARADAAKRALLDPERPVQEVAFDLGFASHAAFSRAFKRWTGLSPSEYRAAR